MIIQYFVLHFILVAMENTCTVSKIPEKEFMSSEKQSKNLPTDENIFERIERSSCDTETTPVSSQHKKNVNRQHLMKKQQKYQLVYDLSDLVCHRSLDF
jgi:hypothetical protein